MTTGGADEPAAAESGAGGGQAESAGRSGAIIERLVAAGTSVATAESLTGGLVAAALTAVPGASAVVRGGVVTYATDLKARLLGVDADLLAQAGPVDPRVAEGMARGVRALLGATYGVATTGEAGPESGSGQPVGTVYVAVAGPQGCQVRRLVVSGGREQVRAAATDAALELLGRLLLPAA